MTGIRKNLRLAKYDYATPAAYFITACVQDRQCLFGEILNEQMKLNDAGRLIQTAWSELPKRFVRLELDEFVVMPNHVHGILNIGNAREVGAPLVGAQTRAGCRARASMRFAALARPYAAQGLPLQHSHKVWEDKRVF